MTGSATPSLQQLLAASNLLVFAERMASSNRLTEEEEKDVRLMICRICRAFEIPTIAERPLDTAPCSLEKARLDAAYEAYWAAEGGTYKSIDAAISAYLEFAGRLSGRRFNGSPVYAERDR